MNEYKITKIEIITVHNDLFVRKILFYFILS